jgi:hypothetical protein
MENMRLNTNHKDGPTRNKQQVLKHKSKAEGCSFWLPSDVVLSIVVFMFPSSSAGTQPVKHNLALMIIFFAASTCSPSPKDVVLRT